MYMTSAGNVYAPERFLNGEFGKHVFARCLPGWMRVALSGQDNSDSSQAPIARCLGESNRAKMVGQLISIRE